MRKLVLRILIITKAVRVSVFSFSFDNVRVFYTIIRSYILMFPSNLKAVSALDIFINRHLGYSLFWDYVRISNILRKLLLLTLN